MDRRIIYCRSCHAKYDVGRIPPGSRFLCKSCRNTLRVPRDPEGTEAKGVDEADLDVISKELILGDPPEEGDDLQGLSFIKMVGTGNDFILVDLVRDCLDAPERAAKSLCDRRFGAGADGLILLEKSDEEDIRMRMFNPDGSEAEACGNGLRCLVKYAVDHGHVDGRVVSIDTKAGKRLAETQSEGGVVRRVRVGMGAPILEPGEIPVGAPGPGPAVFPVEAGGSTFEGVAISMGNPHFVIHVDAVDAVDLPAVGPRIEHHPRFPNRTNVEFVEVTSTGAVKQRTWERGAGETLACGSGACAVCVAGAILEKTARKVDISLRGGELRVEWAPSGEVFLEGPADEVFTGLWCTS